MKKIMIKIVGWMNDIPADKYKHFAGGAVIAVAVLLALAPFVAEWVALTASVGLVTAAALAKERIDAKVDRQDIVATLCGGAVVWVAYIVG